MQDGLKRIVIITGHGGSGKTTLALNLARNRAKSQGQVVLADLDIVNPYFRSADLKTVLQAEGVEVIAPHYAGTNLDIPAYSGRLRAVLQDGGSVIIDVGGDAAGATALGQYRTLLCEVQAYDLLCIVNGYRYWKRSGHTAWEDLRSIAHRTQLGATGLVNCSNLGTQTTARTVAKTDAWAQTVAQKASIPLLFTAVEQRLHISLQKHLPCSKLYPISVDVKKPWEVELAQ